MKKRLFISVAILVICSISLFSAPQDLSAQGKKNFTSANMHFSGERFEKAIPFYELVLEENPHHILTLNKLGGYSFDIEKNYIKANDVYTKLLTEVNEIYAEYNDLLETNAKAAKKFHKKNIKKLKLENIKEITPKLISRCWVKLFLDAQADFEAENLESSLEKFNYVLEIAPDSIKTLKMISFVYSKMGNPAQSLIYMEKVAEKDTSDGMVRTQIGNTNFENGNYEEAVKWYSAASEINVENVDNYFNMALAYNKMKDKENTLMAYEKVLEFEPDNLDAIINASNIHASLGNLDQSIVYLKKGIEHDPENVDWISFLAFKLVNEKRYEEALEYAEKWQVLAPESTEAQQLINHAKQNLK